MKRFLAKSVAWAKEAKKLIAYVSVVAATFVNLGLLHGEAMAITQAGISVVGGVLVWWVRNIPKVAGTQIQVHMVTNPAALAEKVATHLSGLGVTAPPADPKK